MAGERPSFEAPDPSVQCGIYPFDERGVTAEQSTSTLNDVGTGPVCFVYRPRTRIGTADEPEKTIGSGRIRTKVCAAWAADED